MITPERIGGLRFADPPYSFSRYKTGQACRLVGWVSEAQPTVVRNGSTTHSLTRSDSRHRRFGRSPPCGVLSEPEVPEEARPGPVYRPRSVTMLDRIVMDVIDMPFEILLVVNLVLPEPSLPNPMLALADPRD